ncbi:hypothetical protein G6F24_015919 [Rhizopus arrhizus]|nr:hypothetical protein G6F24_015919 [Rhizopus arrhizus]
MRGLEHGDAAAGREQRPCAVPGDQVETARAHGPDDVVAHAAKQGVAAGTHRTGVQATRRQVDGLQHLQADACQIARVRTRSRGVDEVAPVAQVVHRIHGDDTAEVGEHDVVAVARRDRVAAGRQQVGRAAHRQARGLLRRQHQGQRRQRLHVRRCRRTHVHRRAQVDIHAGVSEHDPP